jgi:hypothetical protein
METRKSGAAAFLPFALCLLPFDLLSAEALSCAGAFSLSPEFENGKW